jgi:putative nucleotidyltransferase with HDIG domain
MILRRRNSASIASPVGTVARALLRALELRDPMTASHSVAVADWTRRVAAAADLPESERELAHTAGLLHDIGKLTFPDRILKRDVRLTESDWDDIRMHPTEGARALAGIEGFEPVRTIILTHHERVDGGGYPRGLPAGEVPRVARMIAVVDAYDAMTARDSYRHPVCPDEAIAELRRVAGSQLDRDYVELFIETLSRERPPGARFTHFMRLQTAGQAIHSQ